METTTKSKLSNKPGKTSGAGITAKNKQVTSHKSNPSEDQIREKAKEIYHQRILRGEHGTALDDWNKAEKLLKGS